jgi:hypothetical protein
MWRSVGFMMSFAAVLELVTLVTYCVVILGGKQKRETGWKVLSFMLMLVGIIQCAAMAIVVCYPFGMGRIVADGFRPTSLITTIDSLRVGSWTKDGFFARLRGVLLFFRLVSYLSRHWYSHQKMAMSLFQVSVMEGDAGG